MSILHYRDARLYIEDIDLSIIAKQFDTPCYVYSRTAIESNWRAFDIAFSQIPHRICYAVKANSNLAILNLIASFGSGFDIVSIGELERVIAAGGEPQKIVFSGIGKQQKEIERAIEVGIGCFNVESIPELERLNTIAAQKRVITPIALRLNPNINPKTHAHISTGLKENKFGITVDNIPALIQQLKSCSSLQLIGLACHIGSQIIEQNPFLLAIDYLLSMCTALQSEGFILQHINIGGGLGIRYHNETPPAINDYANAIRKKLAHFSGELIIEPGRAIIGNAGALLTRIEYLKHTQHKNFAIVDAGMNDLIRPALYDAWQAILPVVQHHNLAAKHYDIAGPVCESADILGKDRLLALMPGDLLAIDTAGAYGFSMSSNYNSRCRPAEVLINKNQIKLIRARETIKDLFAAEII